METLYISLGCKLDPAVINGLATDALYDEAEGSEPQRNKEVLQSWDALKAMLGLATKGTIEAKLDGCRKRLKTAQALYDKLQVSVQFQSKSNAEHLPALADGIRLFEKIAELGASPE